MIHQLVLNLKIMVGQLDNLIDTIYKDNSPSAYDTKENGKVVIFGSNMYFKDNDKSNCNVCENNSTSFDDIVEMNLESQKVSINGLFIAPLKKYFQNLGSKHIFIQMSMWELLW